MVEVLLVGFLILYLVWVAFIVSYFIIPDFIERKIFKQKKHEEVAGSIVDVKFVEETLGVDGSRTRNFKSIPIVKYNYEGKEYVREMDNCFSNIFAKIIITSGFKKRARKYIGQKVNILVDSSTGYIYCHDITKITVKINLIDGLEFISIFWITIAIIMLISHFID